MSRGTPRAARPSMTAQAGQSLLGECPKPLQHPGADGVAHLRLRLLEVLPGVAADDFDAPGGRDVVASLGRGVERGDPACQLLQRFAPQVLAPEVLTERRAVGEPLHLHRPLDDLPLALAPHPDRPTIAGHGDHPAIDLGCQPAVQADLLVAEVPAFLQRAVVDEAQSDGLLDLVDVRARQEDRRDVRLADLHRADRFGVGSGVREGLDQSGEFHGGRSRRRVRDQPMRVLLVFCSNNVTFFIAGTYVNFSRLT